MYTVASAPLLSSRKSQKRFCRQCTSLLGDSGNGHLISLGGVGASFLRIQRDDSRFSATYFENEPATIAGLQQDRSHRLPRAIPVVPLGVCGTGFRKSWRCTRKRPTGSCQPIIWMVSARLQILRRGIIIRTIPSDSGLCWAPKANTIARTYDKRLKGLFSVSVFSSLAKGRLPSSQRHCRIGP